MIRYGVTLLSGGLDSTTVTAYAKNQVDHLTSLTFHYGQIHSKEVDCASLIASLMGIEHKLIDISFLGEVAWYSALINPDLFPVPKNRTSKDSGFSIPITYVPLRNTIFLSLSAAYLESQILYAIEEKGVKPEKIEAHLYMAPNAIDYSGYPDCRPEYFEQVRQTLQFGSKLWTQYATPILIDTPIISLSKGEIVKLGERLNAPIEHTWSCYGNLEVPCGKCDSCIFRAKGFHEAGIPDPLLVRLKKA